ncbi:MAG TPA: SDR family oxidoreductase [Casimicrobiaceae bacterium]|nr:SDR family oxidoreductase [Casimicrobiaceae bacterium]
MIEAEVNAAKVMLVTGASRGIGAAVARLAARSGYAVCVNFRSSERTANEVLDDIRADGSEGIAIRADVANESEVKKLFAQIDERFGRVDALVNNAGILARRRVETMDSATLTEVFSANVFSMFYCAREAVQRMSTRHGGRGGTIVNVSSVAARLGGLAGGSVYAASKGAIDTFTLALAKEVGAEGIRVNAVRPGLIDTEIHAIHGGIDESLVAQTVPLGRAGSSEEVAASILWLMSDAASYVHGAVIDVAGGR